MNHRISWNNLKRQERRQLAHEMLGTTCVVCGATEDVEFDHLDPSTKIKNISQLWTCSEEVFLNEIVKCQVLCRGHHQEKTNKQNGWPFGHGTRANFVKRGCKCDLCREANNLYMRELKRKLRAGVRRVD